MRLGALLHCEGLADDGFESSVSDVAEAAAADLRRGCLSMDDPGPDALFDHVYADPHPLLEEERAAYADYLAGFDEES
jgi:2-oxoisovalerate dehydrogenase E1 component alpha subunit